MATIDATVGGSSANSFETEAEANTYFSDNRLPIVPPWVAAVATNKVALIMATRVLIQQFDGARVLIPEQNGVPAYYRSRRAWTGSPASTTQLLPWPRTGMFDRNGNAIPATVIPQEIKDAESELAGALLGGDRTLDSDVVVQGLQSLRVGSVALAFRNGILPQVMPDAVLSMLPSSWFTDEQIEMANDAEVELI